MFDNQHKHWNAWGHTQVSYPISEDAVSFLKSTLGQVTPLPSATLKDALNSIRQSRFSDHFLKDMQALDLQIDVSSETRLRHAHGQSFLDWLVLRSGQLKEVPDGVIFPVSTEEVEKIIHCADRHGVHIIPYGGGTSVVGHLSVLANQKQVLSLSMARMTRLISLDPVSRIARFLAGVSGPLLESQLEPHGFTLGHFPQSFEFSTLGGWVVTRSSGQQSLGYGRIEQLFAGGTCVTPIGKLDIKPIPASSTGPDLREIILGSEGRMGVLTEALVRISKRPEQEQFVTYLCSDWQTAVQAVQKLVQQKIPLSMLRLSNPQETQINLLLSGKKQQVLWLKRYLKFRGMVSNPCMLMVGYSGFKTQVCASIKQLKVALKEFDVLSLGRYLGQKWKTHRFLSPYLRASLWDLGYGVDTLETAVNWDLVPSLVQEIESALKNACAQQGISVLPFTHLSHFYNQGSSIYTTYIFPHAANYEDTRVRWQTLKNAASRAIVERGGTISHHHGVGVDHQSYLVHEKSPLGVSAIQAIIQHFDPHQIMNPHKLVGF